MNIRISQKAGRCRSGSDRGGRIYHAVLNGSAYGFAKALCGTAPSGLSAGWSTHEGDEVTCKKCLEKIAKTGGS